MTKFKAGDEVKLPTGYLYGEIIHIGKNIIIQTEDHNGHKSQFEITKKEANMDLTLLNRRK